jgi:hypothetical protein
MTIQTNATTGNIEVSIEVEKLRLRKLFLAVPMYGGQCSGMYARSAMDLAARCAHYGIQLQVYYLFNESLITRARNYCVDEFLRSECTHLMFIDSDIGFNPDDVLVLLSLMSDESDYDVMAGPYPKKCISWEKVKQAADKGFGDENPNDLAKYIGDYVFNPKANSAEIPINRPVEVLEAGTGFMMIRRKTFDKYKEAFPHLSYKPDHVRTAAFDGTREIMAYFDCIIEPESRRYLSEDYMFCYNVQKMGMKVWFCPWMKLSHVGTYVFEGTLADLAQIGASATADIGKMNEMKITEKKRNKQIAFPMAS